MHCAMLVQFVNWEIGTYYVVLLFGDRKFEDQRCSGTISTQDYYNTSGTRAYGRDFKITTLKCERIIHPPNNTHNIVI